MADKETTIPPPATVTAASSSPGTPVTPVAKRLTMPSPDMTTVKEQEPVASMEKGETQASNSDIAATEATQAEFFTEDDLEADDGASDSALGTDYSDTTSISSSIYKGRIENGRRYQTVRDGQYWGPSDEKQYESMRTAHLTSLILDSKQKNPLFRSPIPETAQHILDIGTGDGEWCRDVADRFPSIFVLGVDLSPPPDAWVPPNCKFEVDDVLKPWLWPQQWDLIHIRELNASFTKNQWRLLYKQAYENLLPGGWIEETEPCVRVTSDDGSLPTDSALATWGPMLERVMDKIDKFAGTWKTMKESIEAAGFTNVQVQWYKIPIGEWTKDPVLKEAGRFFKKQILQGMEGYTMWAMTNVGDPEVWTPEEVQVYLAKVRKDIENPNYHSYCLRKRVWAQKPIIGEQK